MKLTALVPIKENSTRLPNKNFLDFGGEMLFERIFKTLSQVTQIEKIAVNTDSQLVINTCEEKYPNIEIIVRPNHLLGDEITMNSIIEYDLTQLQNNLFLQTHCTNPLLKSDTIERAIDQYLKNLDSFDSLFSVEQIQKRTYFEDGSPINHSFKVMEQTQHLPAIQVENSNLFLFSRQSFLDANRNRIGLKPQLFRMSRSEGIDIDYEEDYLLAKLIMEQQLKDVPFETN
jgi:CMP-N-acetylneuraminic acid synthetase